MRVCPFRKQIITTVMEDGTKITNVHFLECYEAHCPFWVAYRGRCIKVNGGEVKA